jgi:hypothetical protein
MTSELSEAQKFDKVVRTLLSVSHKEMQRRDKEWKTQASTEKAGYYFAHLPRFRLQGLVIG